MAWEQLSVEFRPFGFQDREHHSSFCITPLLKSHSVEWTWTTHAFLLADAKEKGGASCHWNILVRAPGEAQPLRVAGSRLFGHQKGRLSFPFPLSSGWLSPGELATFPRRHAPIQGKTHLSKLRPVGVLAPARLDMAGY